MLGILSRVPATHHLGLEVKKAKVLDTLSHRLRVPLETLEPACAGSCSAGRRGRDRRRRDRSGDGAAGGQRPGAPVTPPQPAPIRQSDLDRTDLELIQIVLNEPAAIARLIPRIAVSTLRDAPLRAILQACYDLQSEGQTPSYENLMVRLDDPAVRGLATDLIVADGPEHARSGAACPRACARLPGTSASNNMLIVLDERERQARLSDLKKALDETDPTRRPGCVSCHRIGISIDS